MRIADGDTIDVGLGLKIKNVPLADQSIPDEAHTDAVIRSQYATIRRGCHRQTRGACVQKRAPGTERIRARCPVITVLEASHVDRHFLTEKGIPLSA